MKIYKLFLGWKFAEPGQIRVQVCFRNLVFHDSSDKGSNWSSSFDLVLYTVAPSLYHTLLSAVMRSCRSCHLYGYKHYQWAHQAPQYPCYNSALVITCAQPPHLLWHMSNVYYKNELFNMNITRLVFTCINFYDFVITKLYSGCCIGLPSVVYHRVGDSTTGERVLSLPAATSLLSHTIDPSLSHSLTRLHWWCTWVACRINRYTA